MLEQVGSIDLTHSTWISMVYRERFEARIPLDKDLDHSLGVLALAVEDTVQTRGEQAAGIMDLTQEGRSTVYRQRYYDGQSGFKSTAGRRAGHHCF